MLKINKNNLFRARLFTISLIFIFFSLTACGSKTNTTTLSIDDTPLITIPSDTTMPLDNTSTEDEVWK